MKQVATFDQPAFGASADGICNASELAIEAWGQKAVGPNSGLTAFAYLWRRFGPPWRGGDDYKSLVDYVLTTSEPDVFLWMHLAAGRLDLAMGYFAHIEVRKEADKPAREWSERYDTWWHDRHPEIQDWPETDESQERFTELYFDELGDVEVGKLAAAAIGPCPRLPYTEDWRSADGVMLRVNQALFDAMKELERPVYIRDVAINIFGRCDDDYDTAAEVSKYAGLGVPFDAMERQASKDKE